MQNQKIIVYGTSWCIDCKTSIAILEKMKIKYDFVNIEENENAMKEVQKINNGMKSVPTILFPDGSNLVEPSPETLVKKLKK